MDGPISPNSMGHVLRHQLPKGMSSLVGGWATPLKNMSSSVGMISNPIYGKKWENFKNGNHHHQPVLIYHSPTFVYKKNRHSSHYSWSFLATIYPISARPGQSNQSNQSSVHSMYAVSWTHTHPFSPHFLESLIRIVSVKNGNHKSRKGS